MKENNRLFRYTYSANEQEEVKNIRDRYVPAEETKMDQLRNLDRSATRPGTIASILVGTLGALLLGVGMSCVMVWPRFFALGIVVGCAGIAGTAIAWPLYTRITRRQREKLAPEILRLTDELLHLE